MGILRGKTQGMVRKEIGFISWLIILSEGLIAQAAWVHGKTAATLGFKLTLQITKAFQQAGLLNQNNSEIQKSWKQLIANRLVVALSNLNPSGKILLKQFRNVTF